MTPMNIDKNSIPTLYINHSEDQTISTNVEQLSEFLNFIIKRISDLAQENLVNIQGSDGILDQYLWMSAIP